MSGFEIVGVVLGAIPLAIEGAKLYGSGISSIRAIIYYDRIFDDMEARLRGAASVLRYTCEELLVGMGISDDMLRDLLGTQKRWDSDSLKAMLVSQMGTADYSDFEAIANNLNLWKRMDELGAKLGVNSQWKSPFLVDGRVDRAKRREFFRGPWKRVKRGLKANKHEQIITAIRDDAVSLHGIVQTLLRLRMPRQTHEQRRGQTISWKRAREHSLRLHKALESSWESLCNSHSHSVWIRFKPPAKRGTSYEPPELLNCSFALGCANLSPSSLPGNWRDIAVLPSAFPLQSSTPAVQTSNATSPTPTITIHPVNPSPHPVSCCSAKICNLCQALSQSSQSVSCLGCVPCLGYLANENWNYHFCEDSSQDPKRWNGTKSLRGKITDPAQRYVPTTREKRLIALLLASVVLQLHGTGWLGKSWTLDDIFTLGDNELCVVYTFDGTSHTTITPGVADDTDILRNETLFSLGEALLELTYQQPVLHSADTYTRYREAISNAKRLQNDELESFASTVAKCLNPASPTFLDYDLEQEAFFNWYYQEIVMPLKKDYDIFIS